MLHLRLEAGLRRGRVVGALLQPRKLVGELLIFASQLAHPCRERVGNPQGLANIQGRIELQPVGARDIFSLNPESCDAIDPSESPDLTL